MKRIYLSWPTGYNLEQFLPSIKRRIIEDCELIYSARLSDKEKDPTCVFPILKNCDSVFMLQGWERDKRCLLEKIYAEYLGKEIYYEDDEPINHILSSVLTIFDISYSEMTGSSRRALCVYARMLFTFACRKRGYAIDTISKIIKRDHSSISHYLNLYGCENSLGAEFKYYKERLDTLGY